METQVQGKFSLLKFFNLIYLDQILEKLMITIEIWDNIW